jgi:hypothetical protein
MSSTEIKVKFEQDLKRVKDSIVAASEHYDIWWIYENEDDRPRYVNVMNRYLGFFRASISAQFTALLLTLSKALDKNTKHNGISMYSLVEFAEKHGLIKSSKLQEIRNDLNCTNKVFSKLQILRNNCFAHLGKLDTKRAFNLAGMSPNDLKKLIDLSINILKSIGDFAFDYGAKNDTYALLNDLSNIK